ncbi:MAG: sulfite exporter TauE/SafE family protein [Acidimicrobiia bacterium]
MEPQQILVVAGAYFLAGFVKGLAGLGFSTTALPFLVLALGLKAALPLVIIPSIASNLMVMRSAGEFRRTFRRFWLLYVAAVPGLLIGLRLLSVLDPRNSTAVLGTVLILYCGLALAQPNLRLPMRLAWPWSGPVGFVTGIVNGLTGSQVIPVLPFLLSLHLETNRFLQATNSFFTMSSLVMGVGLTTLGLMTPNAVAASLAGLVPVWLGIRAGAAARRSLSPQGFRTGVLLVLALLGASLLFSPSI